jgi:hypothetical protein
MFQRTTVLAWIAVTLLSGMFLMAPDCKAQADLCDPDPCQDILNAVPDTCTLIPGGVCAPDDFTCECDLDYSWEGTTNTCEVILGCADRDGDNHYAIDPDNCPEGDDCDDNNADVYFDAPEMCDRLDNDCNGVPDYPGEVNEDGDPVWLCEGDCDDTNADMYPGAVEICDGLDNDCTGGANYSNAWGNELTDSDQDGALACADCDDDNADVYPGAPELCDGVDNQCPGDVGYGSVDEGCDG